MKYLAMGLLCLLGVFAIEQVSACSNPSKFVTYTCSTNSSGSINVTQTSCAPGSFSKGSSCSDAANALEGSGYKLVSITTVPATSSYSSTTTQPAQVYVWTSEDSVWVEP